MATLKEAERCIKYLDPSVLEGHVITVEKNDTFFLGLYMIALGTGGIKPCVSSFGADQFDDSETTERVNQGSFFNWFYFCINIGALISGTVIVWIQDNSGWGIGFAIPTIFMALAIASFFSASNTYRFQKPGGSPLTRMCQVVVAAFHKRHVELPHDTALLYEVDGQNSAIEGSRKLEHTSKLDVCVSDQSSRTAQARDGDDGVGVVWTKELGRGGDSGKLKRTGSSSSNYACVMLLSACTRCKNT